MGVSLRGRNLVSLMDLSRDELGALLDAAIALKLEHRSGRHEPLLAGQTLGMIFQKPSLRTRVSFETGMIQLGGHAIYLAPGDIGLGQRETPEDAAIVLSRYCDLLMARVFGHHLVEELAEHSTVPVINGLSDREHPCQALADLLTIRERCGKLAGVRTVFSGDGNNVAHSLIHGAALTGLDLTIVTPPGHEPEPAVIEESRTLAGDAGLTVRVTNDLEEAARGAQVIYTDVWASMGQEAEAASRRQRFMSYQVNEELLALAEPNCTVMHCLPAHYGQEITYPASRAPGSAIFDQAENRLHAQKALMVMVGAGD